jgi:hypothetical protein
LLDGETVHVVQAAAAHDLAASPRKQAAATGGAA